MFDTVKEIIDYLINNYDVYVIVVLITAMLLILFSLDLLKKPIKKATGRIENERLRKLLNKSIVLLSFGLSASVWVILGLVFPAYFRIDFVLILLGGAFPVVIYALGDGVITRKKAAEITEKVRIVANKGKIAEEEVKDIFSKETGGVYVR